MKKITVPAKIEKVSEVTAFVDEILEANGYPIKAQMQIDIAIDELFSNIANYAYCDSNDFKEETTENNVHISVELLENPSRCSISFEDSGIAYNPLENKDPDVTLSAEERQIGGLGIFIVKKSMDDIYYEYKEGKNILTIVKNY